MIVVYQMCDRCFGRVVCVVMEGTLGELVTVVVSGVYV